MRSKILWSDQAKQVLERIKKYYANRNKSTSYSNKLVLTFKKAVELIAKFPLLSIETNKPNIGGFIVKSYIIFFEIKSDSLVFILTV